jgi:transcriptional regulator with XRE-family HTH domain
VAAGETLADLVARRRAELGMSTRAVERASGGLVRHSSVGEIERGMRSRPGERTLQGLARALRLPERQLREAARLGGGPVGRPFVLPDRADRLTARERRLVLELVEVLLAAREGRG